MKILKKFLIFLCLNLCFFNIAFSQSKGPYEFLNEKQEIFPNSFSNKNQVEVLIFFSFLCSHCSNFNFILKEYNFDKNINIVKVPVSYNNADYAYFAKLYYTLDIMNLLDKLENKIYTAIHKDNIELNKKSILDAWLKQNKVNIKQFNEIFNSFGVNIKVKIADNLANRYGIDGTPFISVDGRFKLNGSHLSKIKYIAKISENILKEREKNNLVNSMKNLLK